VIPSRAVVLRPSTRGQSVLATSTDVVESHGSVYEQDIDFGFIPSDPLEEHGGRTRITEQERTVLRWVDGRRTAAEIAELTGIGTFETFHVLAGLVESGLLEASGHRGPATGAPGVPAWLRSAAPARALASAVVVLAVLGAAAGLQEITRAVAPGPRILPAATPIASSDALSRLAGLDRLRRATSAARMGRLEEAIEVYFFDQGRWPRALGDLVEAGLVSEDMTRDPWGDPYLLDVRPWGYRLSEPPARRGPPLVRERHVGPVADRAALSADLS
jgi:hypothetical protein